MASNFNTLFCILPLSDRFSDLCAQNPNARAALLAWWEEFRTANVVIPLDRFVLVCFYIACLSTMLLTWYVQDCRAEAEAAAREAEEEEEEGCSRFEKVDAIARLESEVGLLPLDEKRSFEGRAVLFQDLQPSAGRSAMEVPAEEGESLLLWLPRSE